MIPHLITCVVLVFLFCRDVSITRQENTFYVCGIGEAANEAKAREDGRINAFAEFDKICNASDDGKGVPTNVEPMRTDCETRPYVGDSGEKFVGYKCYRGFESRLTMDKNAYCAKTNSCRAKLFGTPSPKSSRLRWHTSQNNSQDPAGPEVFKKL